MRTENVSLFKALSIGIGILLAAFWGISDLSAQTAPVAKSKRLETSMAKCPETNGAFPMVELFVPGWVPATKDYRAEVRAGAVFELDEGQVEAFLQRGYQSFTLQLPTGKDGQKLKLKMTRYQVFAPGFQVRTSAGSRIDASELAGLHYHGYVEGEAGSLAAISVSGDEVMGVISTRAGNYNLGKLAHSTKAHILYLDKNMLNPPTFECDMPDDGKGYREEQLNFSSRAAGDCVNIYIEGDYSLFIDRGSVEATVSVLAGVFNQNAILYANENINMAISEIFVWTTPSPYIGPGRPEYLAQFQDNTNVLNGDLGHLVVLDNVGGRAAGFNAICNPNVNERLCFSGFSGTNFNDVPTYSFNVYIFAHELGHLLGSRHTHACVWNGNNTAIDGCSGATEGSCDLPGSPMEGGTIMSYCHNDPVGINFSLGFGTQPGNVIRSTIASASCLSAMCNEAPNDQCDSALPLDCGAPPFSGSTAMATANGTPGGCAPSGGNGTDPGVWFFFVGNGEYYTISTDGSDFDTQINIFSGSCGNLTCIGGDDDSGPPAAGGASPFNTSEFSFCTEEGVIYYIYLDGFNGAVGNYQISLSCSPFVEAAKPWSTFNVGIGNATFIHFPCWEPPVAYLSTRATNNLMTGDNFAYFYQPLCGDFHITTKIESLSANAWAGLSVRENTGVGSKAVSMFSNLGSIVRWESRTVMNGNKIINLFQRPFPYWLRFVRQGNTFFGYFSADGVNFSLVNVQFIPMNSCVVAGLAAFSNVPGQSISASFTHFEAGNGTMPAAVLPGHTVEPAGIDRRLAAPQLFPNPARDQVTLEFPREWLDVDYKPQLGSTLRLRNELGQLIEERHLDELPERLEWDIRSLYPGMYFIEVQAEGQPPQMLRLVKAY
jgi:hypothetical protein